MNNSTNKRFKPDFSVYAEEWKRLYENEKLSTLQIAAGFYCHKKSVNRILRNAGVEIRAGGAGHNKLDAYAEEWKVLYEEGLTCKQIAEKYGCTRHAVGRWIKSLGCEQVSRAKDLTGKRFGRWTVKNRAENRGRKVFWRCECDCGIVRDVSAQSLLAGGSVSCGCYMKEVSSQTASKYCSTHGLSHTLAHSSWRAMIGRCTNTDHPSYHHYGGRGITICDRWLDSFENFYADMGERPGYGYSIERQNNNGNYEPGNCYWATQKQQCRNTRSSKMLSFNGQTKSLPEWADLIGISQVTLSSRIRKGWTVERALTQPIQGKNKTPCK